MSRGGIFRSLTGWYFLCGWFCPRTWARRLRVGRVREEENIPVDIKEERASVGTVGTLREEIEVTRTLPTAGIWLRSTLEKVSVLVLDDKLNPLG